MTSACILKTDLLGPPLRLQGLVLARTVVLIVPRVTYERMSAKCVSIYSEHLYICTYSFSRNKRARVLLYVYPLLERRMVMLSVYSPQHVDCDELWMMAIHYTAMWFIIRWKEFSRVL